MYFLGIYYVFLGIYLFIYRVAQAVVRNAQPYALVERAQPRQAAHTSIGPSPQRVNRRQLSECAHQTPRRVLIHKANDPPPRGPKVVARGVQDELRNSSAVAFLHTCPCLLKLVHQSPVFLHLTIG